MRGHCGFVGGYFWVIKKNQWIGGLGRYAKVFCIKLSDLTREEIAAFLLAIEIYQFV